MGAIGSSTGASGGGSWTGGETIGSGGATGPAGASGGGALWGGAAGVRRTLVIRIPDVGAGVLIGDGASVGEHAGGNDAVVEVFVVVAGGDGDAVVGRAHHGVVVRANEGRILRRGRADAVAEHDPAAA